MFCPCWGHVSLLLPLTPSSSHTGCLMALFTTCCMKAPVSTSPHKICTCHQFGWFAGVCDLLLSSICLYVVITFCTTIVSLVGGESKRAWNLWFLSYPAVRLCGWPDTGSEVCVGHCLWNGFLTHTWTHDPAALSQQQECYGKKLWFAFNRVNLAKFQNNNLLPRKTVHVESAVHCTLHWHLTHCSLFPQIDEDMTARISMADVKFSFQCPGRMYSPAWVAPEGRHHSQRTDPVWQLMPHKLKREWWMLGTLDSLWA